MEHDLRDIFETENSEVEQALKALEEAAFPPEPEEEQQEAAPEVESEELPEEESAEPEAEEPEDTEEESEVEPEPEEEASDDQEPEAQEAEPESEETEECEPESEQEAEPVQEPVKNTAAANDIIARIRSIAAKNGWFTIAVSAAALILAVMVIIMALLPDRRAEETPEDDAQTTQSAQEESQQPTLYITRIDKPGAPEKEYVPVAGTEVVEKTPLYWGVDVSEHQQEIDWQSVASAGADFAMIRAGYRGYTEGQVYADEYFKANMRGALKAGLDVGVYFFSQAVTVEEAVEEAKFVLQMLKGWELTYPIVYDWEFIENTSARTYNMTAEEVTDCAMAFCETIAYAGYTPMLYFGQNASIEHFDLERLRVFDFWLADYTDSPVFPYDFQMWQYSSSGSVDGIAGNVDVNYCFEDYDTTEANQ